tara:strand:+ start:2266 stop:3915 length:1650 start_codon:yes stop_codon:yes gene_type:complete
MSELQQLTAGISQDIITSATENAPPVLGRAKRSLCYVWPFARDAIMSMKCIRIHGLGTITADKHWNIYYDPEFLLYQSLEGVTTELMRILVHLFNRHPSRAALLLGDLPNEYQTTCMARSATAVANELLVDERGECGWEKRSKFGYEEESYLRVRDLVRGEGDTKFTIESLYRKIYTPPNSGESNGREQETNGQDRSGDTDENTRSRTRAYREGGRNTDYGEQPNEPEGEVGRDTGQGGEAGGSHSNTERPDHEGTQRDGERTSGNGHPNESSQGGNRGNGSDAGQFGRNSDGELQWNGEPPVAGSCSHGVPQPWEMAPPQDSGIGLTDEEITSILHSVASKVQTCDIGDTSRNWQGLANNIRRVKQDPKRVIMKQVKQRVEDVYGMGDRSYRRPNRRFSQSPFVMGSNVESIPRITICLDTSGSMGDEDYELSMGIINKIISSFRSRQGINIVVGDTKAKASIIAAKNIKELKLEGGGGTDVGNLLKEGYELSNKPPHIMLAITDGHTPWPSERSEINCPVVAVITRSNEYILDDVPDWMETIVLEGQ